jgi:hypothetical protein
MCWAFGGLELPLFLFLTLLGSWQLMVRRSPWGLVAFAGTALTRPDGLVLLAIGGAFVWLARGLVPRSRARALATAAAIAIVAGHLAFRLGYYGSLVPNTFHAKVGFHLEQLGRGYDYVRDTASRYLLLLPLVLLLPFGRGPAEVRWLLLGLLGGYGAFVVYSGGDPHPGFRLAMPLLPLGWLGVVLVLRTSCRRSRWGGVLLWLVLFVNDVWQELPWLPEGAAYGHFRTDKVAVCGAKIGRWLEANTPPGSVVATNTGGAIPFFAKGAVVIDMLGLTDRTIARANRAVGKGYVGHEANDADYVLDRKPDYIFLCFSCNTSGPCLASDKALMADKRFTRGYEKHAAAHMGLRFHYYTLKPGTKSP